MWIYVGLLLGSLVTSTHDSREACEGRAVILKEKGVVGKCEVAPSASLTFSGTASGVLCGIHQRC